MWHTLNESLSDLCSSPFWDTNLTWYSADPDFTSCFEKTTLVWLPCAFLWLFLPLEIHFLRRSKKSFGISGNRYNICKLVIIVLLGASAIIDVANYTFFNEQHVLVDIIASLSKFFTFILFYCLTHANIKCGIKSSGILFAFSLLLALCGAVQFRTEVRSRNNVLKFATNGVLKTISFYIYYPSTLLVFFFNCFADPGPVAASKTCRKNTCPENDSSILSKMFFSWFDSFLWKGYKQPLTVDDLWDVDDELKTGRVSSRFEKRWYRALKQLKKNENASSKVCYENEKLLENGMNRERVSITKNASILRPLCETFGPSTMMVFILDFIFNMLSYANPLLLKLIINFAENKDEYLWRGIFYAFLLVIIATGQSLLLNQNFNMLYRIGMQIRTALRSIIYKKALRVSNGTRKKFTVGEVTNLVAVDAQRFVDLMIFLGLTWSAPLDFCIVFFFLWKLLGYSALASAAMLATIIPINYIITSKLKKQQVKQMKYKDERIKLLNEILSGIKILKLNAWEPSFEKQIHRIRQKEIAVLKSVAYLHCSTFFMWSIAPLLVFLVTFGMYVLSSEDNVLDAQVAFVSLALFNVLRYPLSMFPMLTATMAQASVSIKRIDKYLNAEELDPDAVSHEDCPDPIIIENGQFSWDGYEGPSDVLRDINLRVRSNELIAVVGSVGSGKSSLLCAILGEMYKQFGRMNTIGTIAYVPQQAWIRNATFRDNITFGEDVNYPVYANILEACALNADLKILPGHDQVEIGEKGINLSGGQKQRISLARAIYANTDIYLLDDPLSAVDSHVGKHIFEKVIGPNGLLKNKTRIWVTHNLTYLPEVDNIVVLQNGKISETGTYKELLDMKGDFADILTTYQKEGGDDNSPAIDTQVNQANNVVKGSSDQKLVEIVGQKLIKDEKAETGNVSWKVCTYLLKAVGLYVIAAILLMNVIYQIFSMATNYWLTIWTNDSTRVQNKDEDLSKQYTYLGVYALFGSLEALSVLIMSMSLFMGMLKASTHIHTSLLSSVLRWPATMFDKIPLGRIINRFSFDIDILDNLLPFNAGHTLILTASLLTTVYVISYSTPLSILVIIPLAAFYFLLQRFFIVTSRQLKRLESTSTSPIYSHVEETVTGAQSIRAYGLQSKFIKLSENKIDFNQKISYAGCVSNRWVAIRLEVAGSLIIFFATFFAALTRDSLNAGLVGLSVSYAFQITMRLYPLIQTFSQIETNIVAVERIKEYSDVEQEASWEISKENVPRDWPNKGEVVFDDFQTRYQEGLELVLKGISFSVKSREKIGIVGRTGSGKSSLTLSLFRIIESAGGRILIDGIDISKVGLHTLRSRLTIIPQDPVLFSGTLRMNLDPTEEYSDENLWRALELANLKTYVSNLSFGLQHEVTEGGSNFSVGQRQLICLARAVLRKSKLLVLDEATAAVDMETDDLIQTTVREEFKDCTILTIAHRLNTILDYDRIIVLDGGRIVEFDSPHELLLSKQSLFYRMAVDAGII